MHPDPENYYIGGMNSLISSAAYPTHTNQNCDANLADLHPIYNSTCTIYGMLCLVPVLKELEN